MKYKDLVSAINTMNSLIVDKEVKMAYELRRAIRRNHPRFMEEYQIMDEERNRLRERIEGVNVEELSATEHQEYEAEKAAVEAEIMELLDKEVDLKIEKVSESFLRDSNLSLAHEMALEFMLIPETEGGDE